jgi:prepilin-type N-terminal cleavage/methylation domain-containing protein
MKKKASRHEGLRRAQSSRTKAGSALTPALSLRERGRSGFTLIEAMIAVAILLVIMLFTGKIFSSASRVAGVGGGNADIMAEATVIERQMREDFERLCRDGFFALQCNAVRNDINDPTRSAGSPGTDSRFWLDPNRDAESYIRADRVLFFMQGSSQAQVHRIDTGNQIGDDRKAQAAASRVYWGHGYQLGNYAAADQDLDGSPTTPAQDYFPPWSIGNNGQIILINPNGTVDNFENPIAPQWTLARQNILLADDGGGLETYLLQGASTASIWDLAIRDGRIPLTGNTRAIDGAASQLNDIRDIVRWDSTANLPRLWSEQRIAMQSALYFPRSERGVPSMLRSDHALTVHTIGTGVSDFMVDWTYENGTGFATYTDPATNVTTTYRGIMIASAGEKPWFGLPDDELPPAEARNVWSLSHGDGATFPWLAAPEGPIAPLSIEGLTVSDPVQGTSDPILVQYAATFGYNESRPLDDRPVMGNTTFGMPWYTAPNIDSEEMYTPWPSAVRITMRLHDPGNRLTAGRIVQFVVNLPERTK